MGRDNQGRRSLRLDPRTKLIVLVLINLALTIAVHPGYVHILVVAAVIFAAVSGRLRMALIAAVAYILVAGAQILGERYLPAARYSIRRYRRRRRRSSRLGMTAGVEAMASMTSEVKAAGWGLVKRTRSMPSTPPAARSSLAKAPLSPKPTL